MTKRPLFFLISGVGFGNATRCLSVIEELNSKSPEQVIHVFSWGKGKRHLQKELSSLKFKLHPLLPYSPFLKVDNYPITMLLSFFSFLFLFPINSLSLLIWNLVLRPKVIVFDSDYHFLSFLMFSQKRVFLGQTIEILRMGTARELKNKKGFFLSKRIEMLDAFFQKRFCHRIFVPTLDSEYRSNNSENITLIPPLVRKVFRQQSPQPSALKTPGALLSGSSLNTKRLEDMCQNLGILVIKNLSDVHSKMVNLNPLIVQGGFSSISEGLALGVHLIVIPIRGHWEQMVNSLKIQEMGRGHCISSEDELREILNRPNGFQAHPNFECSGAVVLAKSLLGMCKD